MAGLVWRGTYKFRRFLYEARPFTAPGKLVSYDLCRVSYEYASRKSSEALRTGGSYPFHVDTVT
jgi:hypothetical protein